eukprot:jgi/Chlat1/1905/Chrsp149S02221
MSLLPAAGQQSSSGQRRSPVVAVASSNTSNTNSPTEAPTFAQLLSPSSDERRRAGTRIIAAIWGSPSTRIATLLLLVAPLLAILLFVHHPPRARITTSIHKLDVDTLSAAAATACEANNNDLTRVLSPNNNNNNNNNNVSEATLARRPHFLPACGVSPVPGLRGTGWGMSVFDDVGLRRAHDVYTHSSPPPKLTTDYVKDAPPLSAVLKNVCVRAMRGSMWQYVFIKRDEAWLNEDPQLKMSGPEWKEMYHSSHTPNIVFAARPDPGAVWVSGITLRLRVSVSNPNHHMLENILHQSLIQLPEFTSKLGEKFFRLREPEYALASHLTRVVTTLSPTADLITLGEAGNMVCFDTLVANQMWIIVLEAIARFRAATFAYLRVPLPRLSRPLAGEELRVSVYARTHVFHRSLSNPCEVAAGVVAALRTPGGPDVKVHITNLDKVEAASIACDATEHPNRHPEFRDQVLAFANTDVYVGAHGAQGALALYLPRCAAFLEIDADCPKGHWSASALYARALGLHASFRRANDVTSTGVRVSHVPRDFSSRLGFPPGSNVSQTCQGFISTMGHKGSQFTPDFRARGEDVVLEEGLVEMNA